MEVAAGPPRVAKAFHVCGTVQGVGFRPYVYRLARQHALDGWVLNGGDGVRIHVEGAAAAIAAFANELGSNPPPAAQISTITADDCLVDGEVGFVIRRSAGDRRPTTRLSPDLAVCDACLAELFDPHDRRRRYPYINCTTCGPRYSIIQALPYDRALTTMAGWRLCAACASEYEDPANRRFHAQPVACPRCGPAFRLVLRGRECARGKSAIARAAALLRVGRIVAVKGIGGYHLACDADNAATVSELRTRKYRKDQAFAVMVRDVGEANDLVDLVPPARAQLVSVARPIVLAPSRVHLSGVAPDNVDLGVMLPYAPLHYLLFDAGAPARLVMTSGNRSSEPIAYRDDDAAVRLDGLADALLIGDRPIARRVDDSVVRAGALGPMVLRRSRGLAPSAVAAFPTATPLLAVGGDLKNAITLVIDGQAYVSQHIGDISHVAARQAFDETIHGLLAMYETAPQELTVAHDLHPEYASTEYARAMDARRTVAVQHHRAHIASVLAERGALDRAVVGVAFDGTGYGDDGGIWGGEFFVGSVSGGFRRAAHLRQAVLPGGDAAARHPVQAAAGFLGQLGDLPDLSLPPFNFPRRYDDARALALSGTRAFSTSSAGRLFDTVAAILGFTRPITFEGQAAIWLEHLARGAAADVEGARWPFTGSELDWREPVAAIVDGRRRGRAAEEIARAFHRGLARGIGEAAAALADAFGLDTIVLSGGVMQNDLLLADIRDALAGTRLQLWTNRQVPPNDGGVSLGQAAIAAVA